MSTHVRSSMYKPDNIWIADNICYKPDNILNLQEIKKIPFPGSLYPLVMDILTVAKYICSNKARNQH